MSLLASVFQGNINYCPKSSDSKILGLRHWILDSNSCYLERHLPIMHHYCNYGNVLQPSNIQIFIIFWNTFLIKVCVQISRNIRPVLHFEYSQFTMTFLALNLSHFKKISGGRSCSTLGLSLKQPQVSHRGQIISEKLSYFPAPVIA